MPHPARTGLRLRRTSDGAGGCDFPADPAVAFEVAPVYWLAEDDTSVVVLASVPPIVIRSGGQPDILERADVKTDEQGTHAMVALGDGAQLQTLTIDVGPLAAIVPLDLDGFDRLEAVYRLLAAIHGRVVPPDTRITPQQRARMQRMLRAYDGYRDGATQQEIAQTLFRTGHLHRDEWQASTARHAIKSLLRDARSMIAGGYHRLLSHRRRP